MIYGALTAAWPMGGRVPPVNRAVAGSSFAYFPIFVSLMRFALYLTAAALPRGQSGSEGYEFLPLDRDLCTSGRDCVMSLFFLFFCLILRRMVNITPVIYSRLHCLPFSFLFFVR